jgi:hypothetical protein
MLQMQMIEGAASEGHKGTYKDEDIFRVLEAGVGDLEEVSKRS